MPCAVITMVGDDTGKVKRKDGNLAWKVERWNTVEQWKQITVTNSVTFVIINCHVAVCTSGSSTGNIMRSTYLFIIQSSIVQGRHFWWVKCTPCYCTLHKLHLTSHRPTRQLKALISDSGSICTPNSIVSFLLLICFPGPC